MSAVKPVVVNELVVQEAQNLVKLWLNVKKFLVKAMGEDPITKEEEQAFLNAKTEVGRLTRSVGQKVPSDVTVGGEKMQDLLRQAISIAHLRGLPKADKQVLVSNWHASYITLAQAYGCLVFIAEGFIPSPKAPKGSGTSLRELKGQGAPGTKKPVKKNVLAKPVTWVVLAIIAAVVYFVMNG